MRDIKKAVLVYQGGIANVFQVDNWDIGASRGRNTLRLLQGDFRTCEAYARGLRDAGVFVHWATCNKAGDVTNQEWSFGHDDNAAAPFADRFRPVSTMTLR